MKLLFSSLVKAKRQFILNDFLTNYVRIHISEMFLMIEGCRGSRKLKVGDFSFTKNKEIGNRVYWSCARAGLHKCKARVLSIVDSPIQQRVIVKNSDHNHEPF